MRPAPEAAGRAQEVRVTNQALRNFVDGKPAEPGTTPHSALIDPCTESEYGTAPVSGPDEVDGAMRAAAAAFASWRYRTPAQRQECLLGVGGALKERANDFAAAETRATGNGAAAAEVPLLVDQLRFFAGAARLLDASSAGEYIEGHTSYVRREPLGVCAQLLPWNFPLLMAVLKSAPAIAAGNTVVLKPAQTTPATAVMFAELAAEFLPPGVLNVVCGDDQTGRLMVEHPVPAMVALTGSAETGVEVARTAASGLKRVQLELGGKTPVIVCSDADLDAATAGIIAGAFTNAGQDCTATSRVLAADDIYEELVSRLTTAAWACRPGPPSDPGAFFGPLNNRHQLDRVTGYLSRLASRARVLTGGHRTGSVGFFFAPTVIADVEQEDEISRSEVFGPVISLQRFSTENEAVSFANGVPQGLAASVWTADHARAMRLSRLLDCGCVWVNTGLHFPTEMPHGGFKGSGYGKDLSRYGFEEYTRIKHVMHQF